MKQNFIFTLLALFSMLSLVSCSDWTETEAPRAACEQT